MTTRRTKTKDNSNQVSRWRHRSNSGKLYVVIAKIAKGLGKDCRFPGLEFQCSCPGWTMHVPRKDCKHIRHIKTHCCD